MATAAKDVYCSLLMTDAYLPGAMVLAHSLRDNGTKKRLAVLVTLDSLHASTLEELKVIENAPEMLTATSHMYVQKVYDHIIPVDRIINKSPANLYLMNRPDLASTFTKIALWRQTQFDHIVYIDADVVALRAPDELFNSSSFAAVPDIGWPDCFNSGVLSIEPNLGDYHALLALAERGISFDGADQGLLNMHFRDWQRLSFAYNCTPSGNYQYVPAYRHFQSSISAVHFIGHQKPWLVGRAHKGGGGVYEELLGRWWAVYDKYYRTPASSDVSAKTPTQSMMVQRHVKGETYYGSSVGQEADELKEPEAPIGTTEPSLTDKIELAEEIEKGEVEPIPTVQQRRYSVDWDPIHQEPPLHSRPEAAHFPHEIYNMSADPNLFQPPKNPEAPKGMYYEVPPTPPANDRPPPIFPWETTAPKPTRVFADDLPPPPQPPPSEPTPSITTDTDTTTSASTLSPTTPTGPDSSEPFAAYTRTNAWDDMPEIDRYITSLPQNRRAPVQVLVNNPTQTPSDTEPLLSPTIPNTESTRRPSMKLTDFPTEIERPSLPVTPAPVRRPSFWGAERDAQGQLPGAEGVPEQSEWDPVTRLAELQRRQSDVLEKGSAEGAGRAIPDRRMPESARGIPETWEEETEAMAQQVEGLRPAGDRSTFGVLNFAGGPPLQPGEEVGVGPEES